MAKHGNEYNFDSRWFKGVPAEDVESVKSQLIGDKKTLDKLSEILYNIVTSTEEVRFTDYDTPSWSHKMAHRNGKIEALRSIIRLISLDNEDE